MSEKDMFQDELVKELKARVASLEGDLKFATNQNLQLLEIYFHLQSMLGDAAREKEITIHAESKWFTKIGELTDEFDPEYKIFESIERLKGHTQARPSKVNHNGCNFWRVKGER